MFWFYGARIHQEGQTVSCFWSQSDWEHQRHVGIKWNDVNNMAVYVWPVYSFQARLRCWPFRVCKLHLQPLLWLQGPGLLPVGRQNQWHYMCVLWKPHACYPSSGMSGSGSPSLTGISAFPVLKQYDQNYCFYQHFCRDLSWLMIWKFLALHLFWNCTTKLEASYLQLLDHWYYLVYYRLSLFFYRRGNSLWYNWWQTRIGSDWWAVRCSQMGDQQW